MGRAKVGGPIIKPGRPPKQPCGQETLELLIGLVRELKEESRANNEARNLGQIERKKIDAEIFTQLRAIRERNEYWDELRADVQKFMTIWKKYLKPTIGVITFIAGAVVVVKKLFIK